MILLKNTDDCCGCGACYAVCHKKAIGMVQDDKGFMYPSVDRSLCVNCGKCESVCSFVVGKNQNPPKSIYIAQAKNDDTCFFSTSGGMFTILSDWFLLRGGVVYSPDFDNNMLLYHKRMTTEKERNRARGSKYVQSNFTDVYQSVINDISDNKEIIVFGTPCQINGLLSFLSEEQRKKIYTVDVICNAVGSPEIWSKHIERLEKRYRKKINSYNFRPKTKGYLSVCEECGFEDGSNKEILYASLNYNTLYYNNLIIRDSCTNCRFADIKRVSDLSIGDYSENLKNGLFVFSKGVSTVLVNSDRGSVLFDEIKEKIVHYSIDENNLYHKRLKECTRHNSQSKVFYNNFHSKGLDYAERKFLGAFKILRAFLSLVKQKVFK